VTLTFQGKLMVFVSKFFPWLADRIAARKVRQVYKDEIAAREQRKLENTPAPRDQEKVTS